MGIYEALSLELGDLGHIYEGTEDETGHYYLSDEFNNRVLKYGPAGDLLLTLCPDQKDITHFRYPCGLAVIENRLYVTDSWHQRVQILDLNGNFLSEIGGTSKAGLLVVPVDVKLGPDGLIWVVDAELQRIVCIDRVSLEVKRLIIGPTSAKQQLPKELPVRRLGKAMRYPHRLEVIGGHAYLADMEKITRIGLGEFDDMTMPSSGPGNRLLLAFKNAVLVYEPKSGNVLHYDFQTLKITPAYHFDSLPDEVFGCQARVGVVDRRAGRVAICLWQGLLGDSVADSEQPADAATIDELAAQFLQLDTEFRTKLSDVVEGKALFRSKNSRSLSQIRPLDCPLDLALVTPAGRERVKILEAHLAALKSGDQVLAKLRVTFPKMAERERLHASARFNQRFIEYFGELMVFQRDLMARLEVSLRATHTEDRFEAIRHWDGCLYYVARLQRHGFQLLFEYRRLLLGYELIRTEQAATDLVLFFIVHCPDEYTHFEVHLRNCFSRLQPDLLPCPDTGANALALCLWALEGVALCVAEKAMTKETEAFERLKTLEMGYLLCATYFQVYRQQGRLHLAFGFAPHLWSILHFYLALDMHEQAGALVESLRAGPLWKSLSVQKFVALYLLQLPNSTGSQALEHYLEGFGVQNGMAVDFSSDTVAILQQLAYFRAQQGMFEEGLAILERVKNSVGYHKIYAQMLAANGQFDEAIDACRQDKQASWLHGHLLICVGKGHEALAELAKSSSSLDTGQGMLAQAIAYRLLRRYDESLAVFRQLEGTMPQTYDFQLGILYRMMGRDQDALACFLRQEQHLAFVLNGLELLATLRKSGQEEALEQTRGRLSKATHLFWEGCSVAIDDEHFLASLDGYLAFESGPLPDLTVDSSARTRQYAVFQSQVMLPKFLEDQTNLALFQQAIPAELDGRIA